MLGKTVDLYKLYLSRFDTLSLFVSDPLNVAQKFGALPLLADIPQASFGKKCSAGSRKLAFLTKVALRTCGRFSNNARQQCWGEITAGR